MKPSWQLKELRQLCAASETVDPTKTPDRKFSYVDVASVSNRTFRIEEPSEIYGKDAPSRARKRIRSGDVIFATVRPTLMRVAQVPAELDGQICSTGYIVLRATELLDARFLFFALLREDFIKEMGALQTGASYPAVTDTQVLQQSIPLPPLSEQKRIVAVLDQAFAALDRARAHAEANLTDANTLFTNYLESVFSNRSDEWSECCVGDVLTLQRGFDITKKDQSGGSIPVISSGGAKSFHDEAKSTGPGVVVGRKGSIGSVYYIEQDFWPHDTTLFVKDFKRNNPLLVFYLLRGLKLAELDTGAANPSLNRNLVHPIKIRWPGQAVQEAVADRLRQVEDAAMAMKKRYENKLSQIADLRQSLLQKAFSGQLT